MRCDGVPLPGIVEPAEYGILVYCRFGAVNSGPLALSATQGISTNRWVPGGS